MFCYSIKCKKTLYYATKVVTYTNIFYVDACHVKISCPYLRDQLVCTMVTSSLANTYPKSERRCTLSMPAKKKSAAKRKPAAKKRVAKRKPAKKSVKKTTKRKTAK